jgi:hypothetical protein
MGHLFTADDLKSNPGFDLSPFRPAVLFWDNQWVNNSRNIVNLKLWAFISRLSQFGTMNLGAGRSA